VCLSHTDCREDVVEDVDVGVKVDGARQRHALLLAAGQVDALFANLSLVAALLPKPPQAANE